ncbi:MAG: hypothetical protein IKK74_09475 [Clostridia bacterium]|nr:hypothetical protein [Clostridia bacterium]
MRLKDAQQSNRFPPDVINGKDKLIVSAFALCLTVICFLIFSMFWFMADFELNPENDALPGASVFAIILVGLTLYYIGFITSLFTTVIALIGLLLGLSSVKLISEKGKRTWAIIVTSANSVALIISLAGLIYFSRLLF